MLRPSHARKSQQTPRGSCLSHVSALGGLSTWLPVVTHSLPLRSAALRGVLSNHTPHGCLHPQPRSRPSRLHATDSNGDGGSGSGSGLGQGSGGTGGGGPSHLQLVASALAAWIAALLAAGWATDTCLDAITPQLPPSAVAKVSVIIPTL
jgi:hypothetical protein